MLHYLNGNIPQALVFLVYLDFHFHPYSPRLKHKHVFMLQKYNVRTSKTHQFTDWTAVLFVIIHPH